MDLSQIMQQVQTMKEKAQAQKDAAKDTRIEGAAGGGMVRVVMNGEGKVLKIDIEKSVIDPSDPEMLGDLVTAAVNDAYGKLAGAKAANISELTGGFDIAGLAANLGIDLSKMI